MEETKRRPRGKDMFNKTSFTPPTTEQVFMLNPILGATIQDEQMLSEVTINSLAHRKERRED